VARILVIDDDSQVRDMLEEMLETSGHEVALAPDGDTALQMQRATPFELVIADIFMPGKHGLETIQELRTEYPSLKILAISGGGGFGRFDFLEKAPQSGATVTMKKPVDWEELTMTVRNLLRPQPS